MCEKPEDPLYKGLTNPFPQVFKPEPFEPPNGAKQPELVDPEDPDSISS